jgi:hypothetical protein
MTQPSDAAIRRLCQRHKGHGVGGTSAVHAMRSAVLRKSENRRTWLYSAGLKEYSSKKMANKNVSLLFRPAINIHLAANFLAAVRTAKE